MNQLKPRRQQHRIVSNKAKKRQQTTNLKGKKNILTTKYDIETLTDGKDKRFSFFADPQKKEKELPSLICTFGCLLTHKADTRRQPKEQIFRPAIFLYEI